MVVVDFIERGREMGAIRWASWEKFALYLVDIYVFFIHQGYLDYGIFLNLQIYVDRWIVIKVREG